MMTAPKSPADLDRVKTLLEEWLGRRIGDDGLGWLRSRVLEIDKGAPDWKFFTSFSAAPRHVGKEDLGLTSADLEQANAARRGWSPVSWSSDHAARTLLLLSYPQRDADRYVRALDQVFSTADVRESVALYQSLPLFPFPERFTARAAEGLRTNMTSVFNAVAHHNPYPSEYFDDAAWNQMVLKALFVGSHLSNIQGLDARANPDLARMLVDYAHERWAAQRPVSPELWRPVAPFAESYLDDLTTALDRGDESEHKGAALALVASQSETANSLLSRRPDLKRRIESGELTWNTLLRNHIPAAR